MSTNRCPDCNKFVGLEIGELEVSSVDVDDEGQVTAEARLVLACTECGGERAEYTFEFEGTPDGLEDHIANHRAEGKKYTLEATEDSTDTGDRFASVDRHSKVIKNWRYRKHFYTASLEVSVECSCGESFAIGFEDEIQASGMEEIY